MKKILLTQNKFALVDDEDYELVSQFTWHITFFGYVASRINNKIVLMHRLVMGVTDPEILVDHKHGIKLDNRKSELRVANKSQNAANGKVHKDNTSGYKGVRKKRQRWQASIYVNGQSFNLGTYATPAEAARKYDEAAKKHFGEYAKVNF